MTNDIDSIFAVLSGVAVLLPLLGAGLWFWLCPRLGEKLTGYAASSFLGISFLCTLILFFKVDSFVQLEFARWISVGPSNLASFSVLLDPLSLALGLVVTGVGALIHIYSVGYMHGDPGFGRFFSYLNLFVVAMLILIWSDNLLGIFLGWEGVGLCSYLLISFWNKDLANAQAGKKAFIVNRIGDFGFLIAMFCLYRAFGTLNIPELLVLVREGGLADWQLEYSLWACLGLVLGAAGKSAQIPLFVWLPDAMAGPTPVSALIHAATMVTAGVYLVCRLQGLFLLHPQVLELVAYMGGATAFFAATIAIFQFDIKKVLAYSTISQLGLMFLAVGLNAPVAAYFHLITHAFFKALLFLGAGSVIHGMHHEQDMRKMGGLRKKMPLSFWTMTIGVLAIAGIPPLSGFVSKDEILLMTKLADRPWLYGLGLATALMTAFYMGRLWFMTFFGRTRSDHEVHESPANMTAVLVVLASLSAVAGVINWPRAWGGSEWLSSYFGDLVYQGSVDSQVSWGSLLMKVGIAVAGLGLAWWKYRAFVGGDDFRSSSFRLFKGKYFIDEIYDFLFVRNLRRAGELCWRVVDQGMIDGSLHLLGRLANSVALRFKRLQTGVLQAYVLWVWIGIIVLLFGAWSLGS
ncbi:MAG: NADH-quinone oxidoreductase subunit L [Bradymonadales bacterium]|nr:MAG: NADH-quinone oxidoreductase subunit L [Bradymonadales bacterium]